METFTLVPGLLEAIVEHARQGYPEEVCGLIGGRPGWGLVLQRGQNVAARPRTEFEMDVATLARQAEFADQGLDLVAIYHSHPNGPAVPSASDRALAGYSCPVLQLICSLQPAEGRVRAFRICGGPTQEVGLRQGLDR